MTVTSIIPAGKSRCKIILNGEFSFVLYKGEIRRLPIVEGEELSDDVYEEIMNEILPKRAILRAMNLLWKKAFTVKELRKKLIEGGYPESVVEHALEYVSSYGYTNDERFAEDYIRYHSSDRGAKRIEADLLMKGVSKEDIAAAFRECDKLGISGSEKEKESITLLLEKKHYSPDMDIKERQKIFNFLLRRGYSAENISKYMKTDVD